jgi:hypothetical protein
VTSFSWFTVTRVNGPGAKTFQLKFTILSRQ